LDLELPGKIGREIIWPKEGVHSSLKVDGVLKTVLDHCTRVGPRGGKSIRQTFGEPAFRAVIYGYIKLTEGPARNILPSADGCVQVLGGN